jgi:hypothetical protein
VVGTATENEKATVYPSAHDPVHPTLLEEAAFLF